MFTQFITACVLDGSVLAIPVGQIESLLEDTISGGTRITLLSGKTFDVKDRIEVILAEIEDGGSDDDDDEWDDGFEDED